MREKNFFHTVKRFFHQFETTRAISLQSTKVLTIGWRNFTVCLDWSRCRIQDCWTRPTRTSRSTPGRCWAWFSSFPSRRHRRRPRRWSGSCPEPRPLVSHASHDFGFDCCCWTTPSTMAMMFGRSAGPAGCCSLAAWSSSASAACRSRRCSSRDHNRCWSTTTRPCRSSRRCPPGNWLSSPRRCWSCSTVRHRLRERS